MKFIRPSLAFRRLVALLALCAALPAGAEISGRVVTVAGNPVEQATVVLDGAPRPAHTDARGGFSFPDAEPPAELSVAHPLYRPAVVTVDGDSPVEVTLELKQELYETIVVTAARTAELGTAPSTLAASRIDPLDLPAAPPTLTEALRSLPSVMENGQGGIFQVFSIRGISRWRVLTLVSGMQITSERRAGVATSFVDPLLMGEVEVVRGPASTWYGSGALGGVVEIFPRRFDGTAVDAGFASEGSERYVTFGHGFRAGDEGSGVDWSVALSHRSADAAETPDGLRLPSQFSRNSGSLLATWGGAERPLWQLTVLPSVTTGIGKPNSEYPETVTEYPREEHLLTKLSVTLPNGSRGFAWLHPGALETRDREAGASALVENETFDFGARAIHEAALSDDLSARFGGDWFARRGVDALETQRDAAGNVTSVARTLDGAELDEVAGYGSLEWAGPGFTVTGGGRYTWQRQANGDRPSRDDDAWSGFVGAAVPLPAGFQITGNVGTGLRFPSLSERFFTGTTGRGEIVANEDLDPERSLAADLGLAWYGDRLFLRGHVYRTEIDDYIDRIRLPNGARTFVNLLEGTIEGVELEGSWLPVRGWTLSATAHSIDAEDQDGGALADTPANRVRLSLTADAGARLFDGRLGFQLAAEHRDAIDDPGSGEMPIPSAFLVEASAGWQLTEDLRLTLRGTNLTDELYFASADDVAVPAPRRSFGVSVAWRR
ncbi:MAG TPA: TonB-dependent receptor [Thermoanaerobaculia bacterium]|nr:TonB-dependent receptor [Thermoanaerobaculia bacterium]